MNLYRKKPVVIEAAQWTGENVDEVMGFMAWRNASHDDKMGLCIHTLEGTHYATPGDWIIKGVKGEFYPCKNDVFVMTYEPATNAQPETLAWAIVEADGYIDTDLIYDNADDVRGCAPGETVKRVSIRVVDETEKETP